MTKDLSEPCFTITAPDGEIVPPEVHVAVIVYSSENVASIVWLAVTFVKV